MRHRILQESHSIASSGAPVSPPPFYPPSDRARGDDAPRAPTLQCPGPKGSVIVVMHRGRPLWLPTREAGPSATDEAAITATLAHGVSRRVLH